MAVQNAAVVSRDGIVFAEGALVFDGRYATDDYRDARIDAIIGKLEARGIEVIDRRPQARVLAARAALEAEVDRARYARSLSGHYPHAA